MDHNMTRPCDNCPFRRDGIKLAHYERAREVANASGFPCHKTVDYDEDVDGPITRTGKSRACAGALIYHEKKGTPTQLMRSMERLGGYDASKLDRSADHLIVDRPEQMVEGYEETAETLAGEPSTCEVCDPDCENPAGQMVGSAVIYGEPGTTTLCDECGRYACMSCSEIIGAKRICNDCMDDTECDYILSE